MRSRPTPTDNVWRILGVFEATRKDVASWPAQAPEEFSGDKGTQAAGRSIELAGSAQRNDARN